MLLLWLAGIPPAKAQFAPNPQIEECVQTRIRQAQSEGRTVNAQLRRRINEICRREASQPQQRPRDQQSTAVPGRFTEEQVQACIREGLDTAQSNRRTVTEELRRQIEEICRRDGALPEEPSAPVVQPQRQDRPDSTQGQQSPVVPVDVTDEQLRECIQRILRFLPKDRQSVTDEQRSRIEQACPEVRGRLAEVLRSGDGDRDDDGNNNRDDDRDDNRNNNRDDDREDTVLDPATATCIQGILRRVPSGPEGITEEQRRRILESCFGGGTPVPQQAPVSGQPPPGGETATDAGGAREEALLQLLEQQLALLQEQQRLEQAPNEPPTSDQEILECIRSTLGGWPSSINVMTESQRVEVSRACGGGGRLGRILTPAAVEQSNQQCIRRVLGRLPVSARDLDKADRRIVEQECFGGRSITGRLAEEDTGSRRGFFTNSQAAEVNSIEKLSNPTGLAVLGILLTLFATAISLFKGN